MVKQKGATNAAEEPIPPAPPLSETLKKPLLHDWATAIIKSVTQKMYPKPGTQKPLPKEEACTESVITSKDFDELVKALREIELEKNHAAEVEAQESRSPKVNTR